jgi:hypothetical protein
VSDIGYGIADVVGVSIHEELTCHHERLFAKKADLFVIKSVGHQDGVAWACSVNPLLDCEVIARKMNNLRIGKGCCNYASA